MLIILFLLLHCVSPQCVVPEIKKTSAVFPEYPKEFRAHIRVTTTLLNESIEATLLDKMYTSTIDQVYKQTLQGVQGSVIFRDSVLGTAGFIHDDTELKHELYFTDAGCMIKVIDDKTQTYEPFHFGLNSHNNETWGFHDVWRLFQNKDKYAYVDDSECAEMICHKFMGCAGPNISITAYSYKSPVISNGRALHTLSTVEILTDTMGVRTKRVFDYRTALRSIAVKHEDFIPPPGIFCSSDLEIDLPSLESFYKIDLLFLVEGWNKTYDTHRIITFSEYKNEGLLAVRYPATIGDESVHKRIVHDLKTGQGWIISEEQERCMSYTTDGQEKSFEEDILALTDIVEHDKKFVEPIWEVLETLKNGNASPNKIAYRGLITTYGIQCDVWEIGLEDYVVEIAFTKQSQVLPFKASSLQRKVPVSLKIYSSIDDTLLAVLDVTEYSVQDNNVLINNLFDTSECYSSTERVLVQFRLNIPYERVHQFGIGSFIQGVTKSVITCTMAGRYQFSHMSIAPVGKVQSIVIFTLSQTKEAKALPIHVVISRLEAAINSQKMFIRVADYARSQAGFLLPIAQSLVVFDEMNPYQHPWQVSVSATISACLGTLFIGLLMGALINHWWNKRKTSLTELSSPTYTQFEDEDEEGGADL